MLTPQERDGLFEVMRGLAAEGRTILFVTHKLHEVMAITDRVTVLRDGRVVARPDDARDLGGRDRARDDRAQRRYAPQSGAAAPPGRAVAGGGEPRGRERRRAPARRSPPSLVAREGEIVGIAGVAGNGQNELVEALVGLRRPDQGEVRVGGSRDRRRRCRRASRRGARLHPRGSRDVGSALARERDRRISRWGSSAIPPLSQARARSITARWPSRARTLIAKFASEESRGSARPAGSLSGGNRRNWWSRAELSHGARVLVAEQPTRGVDIGAIEFIHGQLVAERDRGRAVLLISSELSEILALSDRILVMYEGRILAEVPRAEADEASLGLLMAGRVEAA